MYYGILVHCGYSCKCKSKILLSMSLSRILSGIIAIALALGATMLGGWYFTFLYVIIIF